jgi:nitrite reductase/ring-hydroxylating ferredoxin subunit
MTIDPASLVDAEGRPVDDKLFDDYEVYTLELQRIFTRCWLFLGHESQIPEPGDFVQSRLGYQPMILARNAEGEIRAYRNYCRHRGYRVCHEDKGHGTQFMCDLHGWTYDLDGRLTGAYGYDEPSFTDLDQHQWGLIPVAQVATYKGLIFGTYDPEAVPFEQYLGGNRPALDRMLDQLPSGTNFAGAVFKWTIKTNWKIGADTVRAADFMLFPNASYSSASRILHFWHPTGPGTTEVCAYLMVGKDTSEEVQREMIAHDPPLNYAMGFSRDPWVDDGDDTPEPDRVRDDPNQRAFYRRWVELMSRDNNQ